MVLLVSACIVTAGCGAHRVGKKQLAATSFERGVQFAAARYFEFALRELNTAVQLDPNAVSGSAHGALAWMYATCPDAGLRDGEKALLHAARAVNIAGRAPSGWGV